MAQKNGLLTTEILLEFANKPIPLASKVKRITLGGSRGQGTNREDSDYDLYAQVDILDQIDVAHYLNYQVFVMVVPLFNEEILNIMDYKRLQLWPKEKIVGTRIYSKQEFHRIYWRLHRQWQTKSEITQ